jgi:hypothetical protein
VFTTTAHPPGGCGGSAAALVENAATATLVVASNSASRFTLPPLVGWWPGLQPSPVPTAATFETPRPCSPDLRAVKASMWITEHLPPDRSDHPSAFSTCSTRRWFCRTRARELQSDRRLPWPGKFSCPSGQTLSLQSARDSNTFVCDASGNTLGATPRPDLDWTHPRAGYVTATAPADRADRTSAAITRSRPPA